MRLGQAYTVVNGPNETIPEGRYRLRDANLWVRSLDGGKNGQPVWCSFECYALAIPETDVAAARDALHAKGWDGVDFELIH